MNKEGINFIIQFDEMNENQQNALWNYLQNTDFKWHVLLGNNNFIENNNLKQALNEIKDYINVNQELSKKFWLIKSIPKEVKEDILQIINKVLGEENVKNKR